MPDPLNPNHFCLKPGIEAKLDAMLTGKFAIYDNDFGTDWEIVISTIYDWVQQNGACDCKSERRGSENDQLHQHRCSNGTGRKKGAAGGH